MDTTKSECETKEINQLETAKGKCPIRDWLDDLDGAIAVRIQARLKRVAFGNLGDVKSVGQGVSELRLAFGSGYRLYFAQYGDEIILLLCGGDKSTQKEDIEDAKNYWLDFKRRNNA